MKQSIICTAVILGLGTVSCAQAGQPAAGSETLIPEQCEPGRWESVSEDLRPDGTIARSVAVTHRSCLNESVEMDEFFAVDPAGNTVFRGASFTSWNSTRTGSKTWWVMVGDPGWTLFNTVYEGNVGTAMGGGFDLGGNFLERSVNTFLEDGDMLFEMDRSFDSGRNWAVPFARIHMDKINSDQPELPEDFVEPVGEILADNASRDDFNPILDGHAGYAVSTDENGGLVVTFATTYRDNELWRELSWSAQTGFISGRYLVEIDSADESEAQE